MSHSDFECLRSVPIIAKDGLPTSSSICCIPSLIDNSLSVASAGLDGVVRLVQFEDGVSSLHAAAVASNASFSSSYVPLESNSTHNSLQNCHLTPINLVFVPYPTCSMELDSATSNATGTHKLSDVSQADVLVIGRDNYPVLAGA